MIESNYIEYPHYSTKINILEKVWVKKNKMSRVEVEDNKPSKMFKVIHCFSCFMN